MMYTLETATGFDTNCKAQGMPDFRSTRPLASLTEVEGNFDLAIKFDNIIAARITNSTGTIYAVWTPEDGIWTRKG